MEALAQIDGGTYVDAALVRSVKPFMGIGGGSRSGNSSVIDIVRPNGEHDYNHTSTWHPKRVSESVKNAQERAWALQNGEGAPDSAKDARIRKLENELADAVHFRNHWHKKWNDTEDLAQQEHKEHAARIKHLVSENTRLKADIEGCEKTIDDMMHAEPADTSPTLASLGFEEWEKNGTIRWAKQHVTGQWFRFYVWDTGPSLNYDAISPAMRGWTRVHKPKTNKPCDCSDPPISTFNFAPYRDTEGNLCWVAQSLDHWVYAGTKEIPSVVSIGQSPGTLGYTKIEDPKEGC
jgi:hypothetical protein